jgi:hypothetical protein
MKIAHVKMSDLFVSRFVAAGASVPAATLIDGGLPPGAQLERAEVIGPRGAATLVLYFSHESFADIDDSTPGTQTPEFIPVFRVPEDYRSPE